MEFKNNVFDLVVTIAKELYPNAKAEIYFAEIPVEEDGVHPYGMTVFPDDGSVPQIVVGLHTPVEFVPEILAHEISHVIAGVEAEHGELWDCVFEQLSNRWEEVLKE